ncbi:hypothetical protein DRP04_10360 [Archaeoglobales archaeon]|nr:MAG: hypothetical protein DRP04_10360 [Archaeoglobales archaeon]
MRRKKNVYYNVSFLVVLPDEVIDLLQKLAERFALTRGGFIRFLLSCYLEDEERVLELLRLYKEPRIHEKRLTKTTFSIPYEMHEKLKKLSEKADCSVASVVRRLIVSTVTEDMDIVIKDFVGDAFLKMVIERLRKYESGGEDKAAGG